MKGADSLPMRKVERGMFSSPWLDRFCLIISLILVYFTSPFLSTYLEIYIGEKAELYCLIFLIIMSPFVGDFVSKRLTNYIYKK